MHFTLSKSKYLSGLQCFKKLWLEIHRPELIPAVSPSQQKIFDQGTEVGILARQQFPGGVLIEADHQHIVEALNQTKAALSANVEILFEGAFSFDDTLVRPDVLKRTGAETWDLIEVKSSTEVKNDNYHDVAVQAYVLRGAGLNIDRALLMHINNQCVYPDLADLFLQEDITEPVQVLLPDVPGNIATFRQALQRTDEPDDQIGEHCTKPYECPFCEYCWHWVPDYSIFNLPGLRWTKKSELLTVGCVELERLPSNLSLNEAQARFVESYETKQPIIDWQAIREELSQLRYPLHFLDFETDNPAIPRFEGMHPYEQIPFQFSCHILDANGNLTHKVYLHEIESDPRQSLIEALMNAIKPTGTIVVYNAAFEKRTLNDLARWFPQHKGLLLQWTQRIWDQLIIFRNYYTDYRFGGSNSIKAVLPVLISSMTYADLEVQDGGAAQVTWNEMIRLPEGAKKQELIENLKQYCGQDTLAMVKIHYAFQEGLKREGL